MHLANLSLKQIRGFLFLFSLIVYGALSSPTPDNPGAVEAFIFISLFAAIGFKNFVHVFISIKSSLQAWQWAGIALLIYGFVVPNLVTLNYSYNSTNIETSVLRDMAAFIILLLPMFLVPFLNECSKYKKYLWGGCIFIGLAFSLRVLFLDFSFFTPKQTLLYLANSPLVLFSALLLCLKTFDSLIETISTRSIIKTLTYALLCLLPVLAMVIDFQRASFIALGVSVLGYFAVTLIKKPVSLILPLVLMGIIVVVAQGYFLEIIDTMTSKTAKVGLNMRSQEFLAVWDTIRTSPFLMFFGLGWGAEFESPAVGGLSVSFTHSLLSYMLLKTGLVGLSLTVVYLFFIFEKLARLVFIKVTHFSALFWPFIISILFYASYKSFDYGLVLTLILVVGAQQTAKNKGVEVS